MSSVVCRRLLLLLLLLCLQLLLRSSCSDAARINRSALMDSEVRSEVVDPNNRTIWGMFNLTEEQVSRIRSGSNPNNRDETTQASKNQLLVHLASQRLNEIRSRIRIAVSNKPDGDDNQDEGGAGRGDKALHEKAGYPICNGETSTLNWQQSNNVTLQFASSVFQQYGDNSVNLDSAILRLYKMNPKATATTGQAATPPPTPAAVQPSCPEPLLESQIRVTVSIVHQQKKKRKLERKKRTCNTMMLSSSKTGWVDIDVKCALTYWAQQQAQAQAQMQQQQAQFMHPQHPPIVVGLLLIEVHDDEENQLLPGLYFQPPTCDQADLAVPWSVYRSGTPMPSMENNTLSKCPRLDVRFLGNGPLSSRNFESNNNNNNNNNNNYERSLLETLKRQIYSPSRSREHLNTESTTNLNSPTIDNMLENSEQIDCMELELEQEHEKEKEQHHHHHRRRHHHSQQQEQQQQQQQGSDCESVVDAEESSQQTERESEHHLRAHHNHHHHHHQHHHHKHHQRASAVQNEE